MSRNNLNSNLRQEAITDFIYRAIAFNESYFGDDHVFACLFFMRAPTLGYPGRGKFIKLNISVTKYCGSSPSAYWFVGIGAVTTIFLNEQMCSCSIFSKGEGVISYTVPALNQEKK